MNAGSLDKRLAFTRLSSAKDSRSGEAVSESWITAFTVWGSARGAGGAERGSSPVVATADIEFRIRWRDDVDAAMRIESEGVVYDIQSILPFGRRREALAILARRRTD